MSELALWDERPLEEAFLFNPAYCGALIYEFVKEYSAAKSSAVPFALIFCALPIALHPKTRDSLPGSTVTSLYDWINEHQDLLVDYQSRASNLVPYIKEALVFAASRSVVEFKNGDLERGNEKASFTPTFLQQSTVEVSKDVKAIKMVARWFAKSGSASSILSSWGIRP